MDHSPVTVRVDGVTFQLKERQHFDWLGSLGSVFCVFDQQDSGNISFGIEGAGKRWFVKYAGAKTMEYPGNPDDAVSRLKSAIRNYQDLRHPYLINLVHHFEVECGFAAIFEWFDGENLHPHTTFPPPAKHTHPDSPYFRYRQLSSEQRLASLDNIFEFHVHVESNGYVAVDFYDGSILYDFKTNTTKICDIDFYQKVPYINTMGRMWGSSRFMSPEEFELGAEIDGRTNVFNLGAIAFGLLGGERDRSLAKWEAGKELYEVAARAVENNKNRRYTTVSEFYAAWKKARH